MFFVFRSLLTHQPAASFIEGHTHTHFISYKCQPNHLRTRSLCFLCRVHSAPIHHILACSVSTKSLSKTCTCTYFSTFKTVQLLFKLKFGNASLQCSSDYLYLTHSLSPSKNTHAQPGPML